VRQGLAGCGLAQRLARRSTRRFARRLAAGALVTGALVIVTACAAPEAGRRPGAEPAGALQVGAHDGGAPIATVHVSAVGALGPYSAAVLAGEFCFLSGKIAPAAARSGAFRAEAEAALDAVTSELAAQGLSLADAVSVTVYLTDMSLYAELNEVYAARVPAPYPSRATVGVVALPGGARVELAVIARRR